MATQDTSIGGDSVDLVQSLALSSGTRYIVQNTGGGSLHYKSFTAATTPGDPLAPDDQQYGHRLSPGDSVLIEPTAGEGFWMWAVSTACTVAVTEAV